MAINEQSCIAFKETVITLWDFTLWKISQNSHANMEGFAKMVTYVQCLIDDEFNWTVIVYTSKAFEDS